MTEVISVLQRKGGVGKSTLVCCFAFHLARQKARVLVIDADRQGTCSGYHDLNPEVPFNITSVYDERPLRAVLDRYGPDHDVVLIDTPGIESQFTSHVAAASDLVLIPTTPSTPDALGAANTWALVQSVREANGGRPAKAHVILTKYASQARITANMTASIRSAGMPLYAYGLQELTGFKEMFSSGVPAGAAHRSSLQLLTHMQLDGVIAWKDPAHEVA